MPRGLERSWKANRGTRLSALDIGLAEEDGPKPQRNKLCQVPNSTRSNIIDAQLRSIYGLKNACESPSVHPKGS
jgi:hypothetical protein